MAFPSGTYQQTSLKIYLWTLGNRIHSLCRHLYFNMISTNRLVNETHTTIWLNVPISYNIKYIVRCKQDICSYFADLLSFFLILWLDMLVKYNVQDYLKCLPHKNKELIYHEQETYTQRSKRSALYISGHDLSSCRWMPLVSSLSNLQNECFCNSL